MLKSMKDLQILDNINENSFFLNNDSPPHLEKPNKYQTKMFMSHSYDQQEFKKNEIKKCEDIPGWRWGLFDAEKEAIEKCHDIFKNNLNLFANQNIIYVFFT